MAPTPANTNARAAARGSVGARLQDAALGRFVGRADELDLFRRALAADEAPFVVLHLHGPGGIGKTTLLREFARMARQAERPVAWLDGRDVHASPAGVAHALSAAGMESTVPPGAVLMIDTYEKIETIDAWLRGQLLPRLPARCLVVISGRNTPNREWRSDIEWAALTRVLRLENLDPTDSAAYLAARGISEQAQTSAHMFTRGHPLALSLVADVLAQRDTAFDPEQAPDVIRDLIDCFVRDVPSPRHRAALEVCAQVRHTTEWLLARALEGDDAAALLDWLLGLSFIEQGPHGVFPHDLVREPPLYEQRFGRIYLALIERLRRAGGPEAQRLRMDYLFLIRHRTDYKGYYDWDALDSTYAEPAGAADDEPIVAMVERHEGADSAEVARHWLRRQRHAFRVFRDVDGHLFGFTAHLDWSRTTPHDEAADPALAPALALIARHGPLRPGGVVLCVRFWMHAERYQARGTAAFNLTSMHTFLDGITRDGIAWNFIVHHDPAQYAPLMEAINIARAEAADFKMTGHRYGVFAHDWQLEPPADWIEARLGMKPWRPMPFAADAAAPAAALPLDTAAFHKAVRDALRDYTRLDRLASNPLVHGRLDAAELQQQLREAVLALKGNARDDKLYRALWLTWIEPLESQETVAERLGLPFGTYRYHLARGVERVAELLRVRVPLRP
jgi:hypothetical protein